MRFLNTVDFRLDLTGNTMEGYIPFGFYNLSRFVKIQCRDTNTFLSGNLVINDLPRCLEGVWERIEDMFLSELSTGIGLSERNNGTGVRLDVGYYTANKFGVSVLWDDPDTSTPLDDMQKVFDNTEKKFN